MKNLSIGVIKILMFLEIFLKNQIINIGLNAIYAIMKLIHLLVLFVLVVGVHIVQILHKNYAIIWNVNYVLKTHLHHMKNQFIIVIKMN